MILPIIIMDTLTSHFKNINLIQKINQIINKQSILVQSYSLKPQIHNILSTEFIFPTYIPKYHPFYSIYCKLLLCQFASNYGIPNLEQFLYIIGIKKPPKYIIEQINNSHIFFISMNLWEKNGNDWVQIVGNMDGKPNISNISYKRIISYNYQNSLISNYFDSTILSSISFSWDKYTIKANVLFLPGKLNIQCLPHDIRSIYNKINSNYKDIIPTDLLFREDNTICFNWISQIDNKANLYLSKKYSAIVKEFLLHDFGEKIQMISILCMNENSVTLGYLLLNLLHSHSELNADKNYYIRVFKWLPWIVRSKLNMAKVDYDSKISKETAENIQFPYENRIQMLSPNPVIRAKAMEKYKEMQSSRTGESHAKSQAYLDGLLQVPFSNYSELPTKYILNNFKADLCNINKNNLYEKIIKISPKIKDIINKLKEINTIFEANMLISKFNNEIRIKISELFDIFPVTCLRNIYKDKDLKLKSKIIKKCLEQQDYCDIWFKLEDNPFNKVYLAIQIFHKKINDELDFCQNTLDNATFGMVEAKSEILRIVSQWISGKETGYIIGLEGPPGIGKTTLAKNGIAKCLRDAQGKSRPFVFIPLGGSANGSTLEGHNYTYVGSTWGKIVDALIRSKCMNPVIYIDELDKVSNTEHGKEIISILTHLTDSSQNDEFQDKYFSGIPFDLSKSLIIFSYNDVNVIDKVLLDRIHRIELSILDISSKLQIAKDYIMPSLTKTLGIEGNFNDYISINDEVYKYIINEYTHESGVRRLKEKLYAIIREINIRMLRNMLYLPIVLSTELVDDILKNNKTQPYHSHVTKSKIGKSLGMYATKGGIGGILPIQVEWQESSSQWSMVCTGSLGKVMQESAKVAWSVALNIIPKSKRFSPNIKGNYGIHIHVPEGSMPKDGSSGGCAFVVAMVSRLLNKEPLPNTAITGEIDIQGNVWTIGGLDQKLNGAKVAGLNKAIVPKQNKDMFINEINGVEIIGVENISEVLEEIGLGFN